MPSRRFTALIRSHLGSLAGALSLCLLNGCETNQHSHLDQDFATRPAALRNDAATESAIIPTADALLRQEAALHAALYRAAFDSNVGGASHFVLDPIDDPNPPPLGARPEEFRAQVLRDLSDLGHPVEWLVDTWRTQGPDYFPGTQDLATRLTARIIQRLPEIATVQAEVSDRTHGSRCSRQRVTASWDGLHWVIERDPVRVEW